MEKESYTYTKTKTPQTLDAVGEFLSPPLGGAYQILIMAGHALSGTNLFAARYPHI
jgi:hypothetical protein